MAHIYTYDGQTYGPDTIDEMADHMRANGDLSVWSRDEMVNRPEKSGDIVAEVNSANAEHLVKVWQLLASDGHGLIWQAEMIRDEMKATIAEAENAEPAGAAHWYDWDNAGLSYDEYRTIFDQLDDALGTYHEADDDDMNVIAWAEEGIIEALHRAEDEGLYFWEMGDVWSRVMGI